MNTRSSALCPDDPAIPPATAATGVATAEPDPDPDPDPDFRSAAPPEKHAEAPPVDDAPYDDPLHGLLHRAVADRPLEDVVELITLLESSPEHAPATADALRAAGVDRSVEDVTRLVTLLTRPPRGTESADEAIRAAAEHRPVDEVTQLMELLHRTPLEPHCGRAAVQAAAVNRPVGELAELIGRLPAGRPDQGAPPPPAVAAAGVPAGVPAGTGSPPAVPPPQPATPAAPTAPGPKSRAPEAGRAPTTVLWIARVAALTVFLCGVAHAPRSWTGLSHSVLAATLLASGSCLLLALALLVRAVQIRLVAATVTLVVTAFLAATQVLGGRFGLPDPARPATAMLAPPGIAGTVAAAAALAALVVLLTALTTANSRRGEGR
ncbi:hypothetical protein OIB37_33600 [Streptomyces sp. NBC_00820]|uniref:hypothetical protein n=1 Tax=Streptomyces sp. NBC_00820 TaxID=2975842 RepID=UPI002ED1E052|nr:hypothetical protein OIB37_33600 [Streptomyces sp. NBC_00820]